MITMYHRGGPNACLRPALAVQRMPSRNTIAADNAVRLDGTAPKRGDALMCGSCGGPVIAAWLAPLGAAMLRGG